MRSPRFHHVVRLLLVTSVALNVAVLTGGIVLVSRRGGITYVKKKLGTAPREVQPRPFQTEKVELFRMLPCGPDDVVFAGDSHVAGTPFADAFTTIRNRGIGGDTTAGLLARLDEITQGKPQRVFLVIGSNDIANRIPLRETIDNYRRILARIRQESPGTRVFVVSVPPTRRELRNGAMDRNPQIRALNEDLRALASAQGITFIDLAPALTDTEGDLKKELAMDDGLHLNPAGRLAVCEVLRPHVPSLTDQATTAGDKTAR
jgi:lysophospholipase L1-like esterase